MHGAVAKVETEITGGLRLLSGLDDTVAVFQSRGEGLFEEKVFVGFKRRHGGSDVQVIRRGNQNRIDVLAGSQVMIILHDVGVGAKEFSNEGSLVRVVLGDADQVRRHVFPGQVFAEPDSAATRADDTDVK